MNREEFMNELERLLCDISETERAEALQYYREYFEDANMPDEEVIRQLGSASSVANSIREELADKELVPYTSGGSEERKESKTKERNAENNSRQTQGVKEESKKDSKDTWIVILLVLLGIFGSPFIIGAVALVLGVLLMVVSVLLGIVLIAAICVVAFGIAAVASLIATVMKIFVSPLAALLFLGTCLLCTGLCFLSIFVTWKMCTCILPGFFTGLFKLFAMPFRKKQTGMA